MMAIEKREIKINLMDEDETDEQTREEQYI